MLRELLQILTVNGYRFDPIERSKNIVVINTGIKQDKKTLHKTKHDVYDFLTASGFTSTKEKVFERTVRTFNRGHDFIMVESNMKHRDIQITIKDVTLKTTKPVLSLSKTKRVSYRLPRLRRGSLGTGEYAIHVGDKVIGKIVCDSKDHDINKPNWHAELYDGFDHLAFPDADERSPDKECVVYNQEKDDLCLYSKAGMTVVQTRQWITSVFDRDMWNAALVPM